MLIWPVKDPNETLDYQIDWDAPPPHGPRLASGDIIVSSEWEIVPDDDTLTVDSESFNDTVTTLWLSDGTLNQVYTLTNRVTTAAGRIHDQTMGLTVRAK